MKPGLEARQTASTHCGAMSAHTATPEDVSHF
jgi:hypothetical protein